MGWSESLICIVKSCRAEWWSLLGLRHATEYGRGSASVVTVLAGDDQGLNLGCRRLGRHERSGSQQERTKDDRLQISSSVQHDCSACHRGCYAAARPFSPRATTRSETSRASPF